MTDLTEEEYYDHQVAALEKAEIELRQLEIRMEYVNNQEEEEMLAREAYVVDQRIEHLLVVLSDYYELEDD